METTFSVFRKKKQLAQNQNRSLCLEIPRAPALEGQIDKSQITESKVRYMVAQTEKIENSKLRTLTLT